MEISLNKKKFVVNEDEFPIHNHPIYTRLILRPQIGIFDREIGLIETIFEKFWWFSNFIYINHGINHGGYIPLKLSHSKADVYIVAQDSNHLNNFQKNTKLHDSSQKIRMIDSPIDSILNKYDKPLSIMKLEKDSLEKDNIAKDLFENDIIILTYTKMALKKYNHFDLSDSNLQIYIPHKLTKQFKATFKKYLNQSTIIYDNLINLCMIVKDAGEGFKEILDQNIPYIDKWTILDTGSTDGTIEIIKEAFKNKEGNLYQEPFINFRESRNRCLDLAGESCKFNIMLDDTYILSEGTKNFLQMARSDEFADSYNVMVKSHDTIYGSNRITKSDRKLRYIYKIHEIIQNDNNIVIQIPEDQITIHDISNEYMQQRTKNRKENDLELLFEEIEENPNDPRHLYYIGQTYIELERWAKAYEYFEKRIKHSVEGYREEVTDSYFQCAHLAEVKLNLEWKKCEELYLQCHIHEPTRADPLFCIGYYYFNKNQMDKAFEFFKKGFKLGFPRNVTSNLRPNIYNKYLPKFLPALCYLFEDYKLGEQAAEKYLCHNSHDDNILSYLKIFRLLNKSNTNTVNISDTSKVNTSNTVNKVNIANEPIICFVADGGFKSWSGNSINNEGVGGSETHIIEISRNIAKITNYQVYVFCRTEKEETFENVIYKNIDKYIPFLNRNKIHTCIISRFSEYIPITVQNNVENVFLIVHDLLPSGNIIPMNDKVKGIFCMTEWHKEYFLNVFPMLKDITNVFPNGINIENYPIEKIKKKRHSFIYSSFPNRGLINLLKIFPKIRKRIPDATLDVFCDTKNHWMQSMFKKEMDVIEILLKEQEKYITNHGWVCKKVLREYWMQSEIWLYPCTFKETFCITALEAAASCTLPVTTNLAALNETVGNRGIMIPGDPSTEEWQEKTINKLLDTLDNPNEKNILISKNRNWAEKYDWLNLSRNLVEKYIHNEKSSNEEIIFVTAYKNIGRENWEKYKRTNEDYISYFLNLAHNIQYKLVVFVETSMMNKLKEHKFRDNIMFNDIKNVNTFFDKYLKKEKEIMNSTVYKNKIPNERKDNPEHWCPEYNLINHSKINFVRHVKNLYPNYNFYSWLDFGCIRNLHDIPKNINISKLKYGKITYHARNIPTNYISPNNMLSSFDIYLTGSMFIIDKYIIDNYEMMYEKMLLQWYDNYICDDDQSLILQLYFEHTNMFYIMHDESWYSLFRIFLNQNNISDFHTPLCLIMEKYGSDKGCTETGIMGRHNYTKYYYNLFLPIKYHKLRVFELGLGTNNIKIPSNMGINGSPGASLRGWKDFFVNSDIFGADIDKDILFNEDRIKSYYCDQTSPKSIMEMWNHPDLLENFDIIIEDGLHTFDANVCFFNNSIHKLKKNGTYIIEDVTTKDVQYFIQQIKIWKKKYSQMDIKLNSIPHPFNNYDNCLIVIRKY